MKLTKLSKEPSVTAHYEYYAYDDNAHDEWSIGYLLHWLSYRPYPSPFLVSSPVALKFLNVHMVVQYNNYGKSSITVSIHNIRCPYTIQSGIPIDFYTISGLNFDEWSIGYLLHWLSYRPYPSPFLVSSPVALKFLNVLVLNIAGFQLNVLLINPNIILQHK
jgi:hypothetical protein